MNAQTDLNVLWVHLSEDTFYHITVHFIFDSIKDMFKFKDGIVHILNPG